MPNNLENPKKILVFSTHKRNKVDNWDRQVRMAYPYSDLRIASIDPEKYRDEDEFHDPGAVALGKAKTVKFAIDDVKKHLKLVLDNVVEGRILGGDVVTMAENERGDSVALHKIKRQIPNGLEGEAYRRLLESLRIKTYEELLTLTSRAFAIDWWTGFGAVAMLNDAEHTQVSHYRARFKDFPAEAVLAQLYQADEIGEFEGLKVGPRAYWAEMAAEHAHAIEQVNSDGSVINLQPKALIDVVVNNAIPAETLSHLSQVFVKSFTGEKSG